MSLLPITAYAADETTGSMEVSYEYTAPSEGGSGGSGGEGDDNDDTSTP